MEEGQLKQGKQVAMESREEMVHLSHTHTLIHSHRELAEFGLDTAVPHAHPGEGRADVSGPP